MPETTAREAQSTQPPLSCGACGTMHGYIGHDCLGAGVQVVVTTAHGSELQTETEKALRAELELVTSQRDAARQQLREALANAPRLALASRARPLCTACARPT